VSCLLSNHASDFPRFASDHNALADDNLIVPTTDFVEPDESIVIDIGNNETDLVDVPFDDDRRSFVVGEARIGIPDDIPFDTVAECTCFLAPDSGSLLLESGRARHRDQTSEKCLLLVVQVMKPFKHVA